MIVVPKVLGKKSEFIDVRIQTSDSEFETFLFRNGRPVIESAFLAVLSPAEAKGLEWKTFEKKYLSCYWFTNTGSSDLPF